jgi:chromosome segregation ATPase
MPPRNIRTLIKLNKLHVDEQRRVLAIKQNEADALMAALAALQNEVEEEKNRAGRNEETAYVFGAYIAAALEKQDELQHKISAKEREVAVEREKLAALYEELKRVEITQKKWDTEFAEAEAQKEIRETDERASDLHQRKEK